jgi:hypothetical protein
MSAECYDKLLTKHPNSHINMSDSHKTIWQKLNKMTFPDTEFLFLFSAQNAYCCLRVGEKIERKEGLREGWILLYEV